MVWHDCLVRPDYVAWHDELGMAWHDCWHGSRRRCCAEVVRSKGEVLPSSRAGPARFLGTRLFGCWHFAAFGRRCSATLLCTALRVGAGWRGSVTPPWSAKLRYALVSDRF